MDVRLIRPLNIMNYCSCFVINSLSNVQECMSRLFWMRLSDVIVRCLNTELGSSITSICFVLLSILFRSNFKRFLKSFLNWIT